MHTTTVAADPAKNVFPLAVGDLRRKNVGTQRLTRSQFERSVACPDMGS